MTRKSYFWKVTQQAKVNADFKLRVTEVSLKNVKVPFVMRLQHAGRYVAWYGFSQL